MKRKFYDSLMDLKSHIFRALGLSPEYQNNTLIEKGRVLNVPSLESLEAFNLTPKMTVLEQTLPLDIGVTVTVPETRYLNITDGGLNRKLAYTISGNMKAPKVLLCLPGLLETKASFMVLHAYFLRFEECKVISVDFPGRGDSESISESDKYKMSLYLSDIQRLMKMLLDEGSATTRFTVLGTSMGGVLAMYLTQSFGKKISEIILNDIALTVNWTALYSLYKSMKNEIGFKEVKELVKELRVDERAISDVQLPGHFDLSFRADVWGMNFHEAMEAYTGRVALIYGSDSKICSQQRVTAAKAAIPALVTFEVEGAGHPVPFTTQVCEFIQLEMKVK